jgi:hypothetical protein
LASGGEIVSITATLMPLALAASIARATLRTVSANGG